jgi:dihydrofolate synthase/folylpolyglutamate synthase
VVDAAHTPASAAALARALREEFPGRRLFLVCGVAGDKDVAALAAALRPRAFAVWATAAEDPRSLPAAEVAAAFAPAEAVPSVAEALRAARAAASPGDLVCATGSLRVVAEARAALGRAG